MATDANRLEGFELRELRWQGARLVYAVGGPAGAAPPVVLVHGLGGTIENWRALAPPLAAERRLLVPDLPGHGGSEALPAAPDVGALADAVLAGAVAENL
ncbi:MAG TPA: alpha/beta fold hydrolase, partial [Gaiellaceae bacterium]|nr:alpha/beta fold hydrolase [Gaiellaceae bacterium]